MEAYKGHKLLRPITIKELILAGARDEDTTFLLDEGYELLEEIPIIEAIDYASSCDKKTKWLEDNTEWRKEGDKFSGFVKKVEKEYEVKLGDRYTLPWSGEVYTLHRVGNNEILLLNSNGKSRASADPISVKDIETLTADDLRRAAGAVNDDFDEFYATRVPYKA